MIVDLQLETHHQPPIIEFVPIDVIDTASQVRKTFDQDELLELANEIAANGLINEPVVAKLDEQHFPGYDWFFEQVSGIKVENPKTFVDAAGKKWYYRAICGERRYRAQLILYYYGCTECRSLLAEGETMKPGECYKKHFGTTLIRIKSAVNIDPVLAKMIQFSENHYVKPPFHEEADEYYKFYKCMCLIDNKMTMKKFSKRAGISVERLRKFLWFCELPEKIQDAVREGTISPANALELRRILNSDQIGERLKDRMIELEFQYLTLLPSISNKNYHERISHQLNSLMQMSFFNEGGKPLKRKQIRKIVGEKLLPGLLSQEAYVKQLAFLIKNDQVGKGKVYSGRSPSRQVRVIFNQLETLVPGLKFTPDQRKLINSANFEKPTKTVSSKNKTATSA